MIHTATYIIEGRFAGQSQYECWAGPHNQVFICSTCGKEWARAFADTGSAWRVNSFPCRQHRPVGVWDWGRVPGALTSRTFPRKRDLAVQDWLLAIEHLPLPVLQWEFERELDFQGLK